MRDALTIRDISAPRGETARGWLEIGETAAGALRLPLVLINGAEDGPRLCLTAGVHATEYAPIAAVMRLVQSIRPAMLRGAIVAVPVTNTRMFEQRTGFT
jgi:predicted deacylase